MPQQNNDKPKRPPRNSRGGKGNNNNKGNGSKPKPINSNLTTSRGQAVRAQRRSQQDAQRIASQYVSAETNGKPRQGAPMSSMTARA